jgi:hypothetical protein
VAKGFCRSQTNIAGRFALDGKGEAAALEDIDCSQWGYKSTQYKGQSAD